MLGLAGRCCASSAASLLRGARSVSSPLQDLLLLRGGAAGAAAAARECGKAAEGGVTLGPNGGSRKPRGLERGVREAAVWLSLLWVTPSL